MILRLFHSANYAIGFEHNRIDLIIAGRAYFFLWGSF